jgi:hypothetical protein
MTPEVIQKLEQAFSLDCTDAEACMFANISPSKLYEYQVDYPEFLERKRALKEKPVLAARSSVVRHMEEDGSLALKYLERKKKEEFSPRQEVSGAEGGPVVIIDAGKNPYEDE